VAAGLLARHAGAQCQRRYEERMAALERRLEAVAGRWEAALAGQEAAEAQPDAAGRPLQRSTSFYNMFSLSRG